MGTRTKAALLLCIPALVAAGFTIPAAGAAPTPLTLQASWEMNEPAGATTMLDSGPHGIDAPIDQSGLDTGFNLDGATGYRWPRRNPTNPPASPERVIVIPDGPHLDPLGGSFTVEVRFRTKEKFGNITQKGQATTPGGQWKIQNPGGRPSCLFNGSLRRGATRTPTPINDNVWHTLQCVKTPTQVELWIDGVRKGRNNGAVGNVDNAFPMTIGGKIACDQVQVTCDYFSGEIDYIRLYRS